MVLTSDDYVKILQFYKMEIPKSKRLLKMLADKILGEKLCRCIKKIEPENESRSIGICTKTIFNRKGLTRGNFTCKRKRSVTYSKQTKSRRARRKL
jgi:hypothetical protein